MLIAYRHISNPDVEEIHDTEKSLKGSMGMILAFGGNPNQDIWDGFELDKFKYDKEKGLVLDYHVITE